MSLARLEAVLLVVLAAVIGIAVGYGLRTPYLAAPAVGAALLYPLVRRWTRRAPRWLEALLALGGGAAGLQLGMARRDVTLGLAAFLAVTLALKLLLGRSERDKATLCSIAVALAAAAASEAVEPLFGVLLALSLGAVLTCAALRGVRALGGEGPAARPLNWLAGASRGRLLRTHLRLSAALVGGSLLFFLACPRLGAKLLPSERQSSQRLGGFSEEVGLDDIGRIKQDDRVAFRVELLEGDLGGDPYWRGRALDRYDGENWSASHVFGWRNRRLDHAGPLGYFDPLFVPAPGARRLRLAVYLEPLGSRCIFLSGGVQRLQFKTARPRRVECDAFGAYLMRRPSASPLAYETEAYSAGSLRLTRATQRRLARACLRIPFAVDPDPLNELAQQVLRERGVAPNAPRSVVAGVLERYLSRSYRYTLDARRTPDTEPIEDFLFHKREGHCELFASAHAMMLRSLGIPARLVTGFRGGSYSAWSSTYTVRHLNAHAWVEALTERGWQRFDPTPAEAPRPSLGELFELARTLAEWLELRWFANVIAFDAYDQRSALRYLAGTLESWWLARRGLGPDLGTLGRVIDVLVLAALLGLVAGVVVLGRRLRSGRRRRADWRGETPAGRALEELLRALAARGFSRAPGETPLELAARAGPALGLDGRLGAEMRAYYGERFGERPLGEAELQRLRRLAGAVRAGSESGPSDSGAV